MQNFKNFPEGYTSDPSSRTWEGAGMERDRGKGQKEATEGI